MSSKFLVVDEKTGYYPQESIIVTSNNALSHALWSEVSNDIENQIFLNINNSFGEKKAVKDYFKFEETFPVSAGLLLTNKCQLKCVYCFYNSGCNDNKTLREEDIVVLIKHLIRNAKIIKAVVNEYQPQIKIVITGGGEPTADFPMLQKCIGIIRNLCAESGVASHIHLVSNGIMKTSMAEYIVTHIDSCGISFDGLPYMQNTQRPLSAGGKSYEILSNTTRVFDDLKYEYHIRTTVEHKNFDHLIKMADFVYTNFLYMTNWQVEPVYIGGRAANYQFSDLISFATKFNEVVEYSREKYGRFPINSHLTYKTIESFCSTSLGSNFWMDAYGDIIPCAEHFDKNKYRIAHIEEERIVEDLNEHDSLFCNYKDRMRKCCSDCIALYQCAGGCPLRMNRNQNGQLMGEYAINVCKMIKEYWKSAVLSLASMAKYSEMEPEVLFQFEHKGALITIIKIITT